MLIILINYATIIALLAITGDVFIQIAHIYKRKSSTDISIFGATVRVLAAALLMVKYVVLADAYLLIGQALFLAAYVVYFSMLVFYRK